MAFIAPSLDHVVVDARDRLVEAARVYRALGFQLTERGRHTLGSTNHLAVFENNYLELLGFDEKAGAVRAEILAFPIGLNGLVFGTDQPELLFGELQTRGLPTEEPIAFSRPVHLADGTQEARFRVVRLRAGTVSFGRMYFCHHLTRHLVWRAEWQQHANGAESIARIVIAARNPAACSSIFVRIFGANAVTPGPHGSWKLAAGAISIQLVTAEELTRQFGDAIPDPAGRVDYMAVLSIRTASLSRAAQAIRAGAIRGVRIEPDRILVPAKEAMNVAIEFVEQ